MSKEATSEQTIKRTRMSGEERRELILRQARRVFASSNYAEASTSELARASGVTEPMLYKHFGSKKGLFLAVLREFGQQFLKLFEERIRQRVGQKSIMDALEHVVEDYSATMKSDPEINHVLFQAVVESHDADIAKSINAHNQKVYSLIRQLVTQAQQDGNLAKTLDPDVATLGYTNIIIACQYSLILNHASDVVRLQPALSHIWLRGLRASES